MNVLLIVLIFIVFGGAAVFFIGNLSFEKKTREQFLDELAKFLEGTIEPIEDDSYVNSYRINFNYKDEQFMYEDIEKQGFKDKIYMAYLKTDTSSKLTLTFTEKKHSLKIKSDIFIASDISTNQNIEQRERLEVPDYLKDLNVYTNNPSLANPVLEDKRVAGVLKQLKNKDSRGYPFLAIAIVDGVVILQFYSTRNFKPNIEALQADIPSMEGYLDLLVVLAQKIKQEMKNIQ